jgi:hypothetical protein
MRFIKSKKGLAVLTILAALATAVGAYAYFTANGSGTGTAKTATPVSLTITQVGAGYDSLVPTNTYHQDQTFAGAGISEFGNDVTLANTGAQRLTSVVVAFHNWNGAITNLPITLTINNTTNGPYSVTRDFSFAAAPSGPSTTNITFNLGSGVFVEQEFVYGVSFDSSGAAGGLNVALSSSKNNLTVGSDTDPGTVWLTTSYNTIGNDFPSCSSPVATGVFESVNTACGESNSNNPGAYGTPSDVTAGSADIPAAEFNVAGGTVAGLSPGSPAQPVDFAITNVGSSNVHVNTVTTTVGSLSGAGSLSSEACTTGMYPITGSPAAIDATIPPGTTVFSPSGTAISLTDDGNNQDNCEGATANLTFQAS